MFFQKIMILWIYEKHPTSGFLEMDAVRHLSVNAAVRPPIAACGLNVLDLSIVGCFSKIMIY